MVLSKNEHLHADMVAVFARVSVSAVCFQYNFHLPPPCCKLAQVLVLSSPPSNIKLSVQLPSSCNAAPLIAKATTQLKAVAFHQPITHNQILCCYCVSWPGLLNVQQPGELFLVDREIWQLCQTWTLMYLENWHLLFSSILKIYKILLLPHLP